MGGQPLRDQGDRVRDHPVEDNRHPGRCSRQDHAGDRRVLEPPERGEDAQGIVRVRLVQRERLLDDAPLEAQGLVVYAGAAACRLLRGTAGKRGDEGRGRGCVADAHVAGDEKVHPAAYR